MDIWKGWKAKKATKTSDQVSDLEAVALPSQIVEETRPRCCEQNIGVETSDFPRIFLGWGSEGNVQELPSQIQKK